MLELSLAQIWQKLPPALTVFTRDFGYDKSLPVAFSGYGHATRTKTCCTSPAQNRLSHMPSRKTWGYSRSRGRLSQVSICLKIFWFQSLIVLGLPLLPNKASVISSIRRTETPVRYISANTSSAELSRRRYHSMMAVSKGTCRNFDMLSCTVPALVCKLCS